MYFLGTISGASGAYSNQATGASGVGTFLIPPGVRQFYLQASQTGLMFEFGVGTGSTGSTFATTKARGAVLQAPSAQQPLSGPYRSVWGPEKVTVVSVYNDGGVSNFISVRVYASPTA